jgi:toxin ParE1/3/4
MAEIVWTSQAEDDLTEIARHISSDSEYYATVFVMDVLDAVERLAEFPLMGRIVPEFDAPQIRELLLGSYRVVYRTRHDLVEIATIYHGARLLPVEILQ